MTDEEAIPIAPPSSCQRPQSPHRPSKLVKPDGGDFPGDAQGEERVFVETNMVSNPSVQRYLVAIEYIGTRFSGAQKQANGRTIVGVLEDAFRKFTGRPAFVVCSSRTDTGVHALSNVCHVDVERVSKRKPGEVIPPHEPSVIQNAVNHFLHKNGGDMMIIDVQCVPSDFHARYKAQERTYFYKLLSGDEPLSTFEKGRVWHVPEELDLIAMQKACQVLVGDHDFSSFRGAACQAKSPVKTLDELSVIEVASSSYFPSLLEREQNSYATMGTTSISCMVGQSNNVMETSGREAFQGFGNRKRHRCLVVTARARSFLYHQVRLIVGVLKQVGTGEITVSDVERILKAKMVSATSPMAPSCGLYLGHVKYDLPPNI